MSDETAPLLSNTPESANASFVTYPPSHEGGYRTLVLLFDGTGDTDDADVSNVIELRNMLYPREDEKKQLVYYQRGIGTYNPHFPKTTVSIPLVSSASGKIDGAVAWSLSYHVIEAYEWLVDNYKEGDKICMFGFSRGAYTARALAGMISKVGLLPLDKKVKAKSAFESYEKKGAEGWAHSVAFKRQWESRNVIIEFVGVWDTVNSVGMITAKTLPFTATNQVVKTMRHAVALDERRARFRTNMWNSPIINEKNLAATANWVTDPTQVKVETDVDQVWFAGCHCDVGGGSVPNGTRPNLAHIPLRWMVRECFKTNTGLMFDASKLAAIGLAPNSLYPVVLPRPAAHTHTEDLKVQTKAPPKPGMASRAVSWVASWWSKTPPPPPKPDTSIYKTYSEERLDLLDALAPIFDQLIINSAKWWVLENYPLKVWSHAKNDYIHRANNKRGRSIQHPLALEAASPAAAAAKGIKPVHPRWCKIRVHRTVKTRMECPGDDKLRSRYVPAAKLGETPFDKLDPKLIEWVD
ncbi:hypothetical protein BDZ97DRAFT_63466 [Flammula alnicola]|nr:hypothetical protein BDZ97DRAFT_63466 [Flammula alnicola]